MDLEKLARQYRMTFDLHTHTTYSRGLIRPHGKGSVEENVASAVKAGIKGIAITDHGPGHIFYGIKEDDMEDLIWDIEDVRMKYPDTMVFFGVEANIIDVPGHLDVDLETAKKFDFIIAGYHFGARKGRMIKNWLANKGLLPKKSIEKLREINTEMTVKALYENDIKILTHPGDKYPIDMEEIARACEDTRTLMEINTHHGHLTVDELKIVEKYNVMFVIGSDAHSPDHVGDFAGALARALEAGIDLNRIVNIEKCADTPEEEPEDNE